jgi:hypothetical protein
VPPGRALSVTIRPFRVEKLVTGRAFSLEKRLLQRTTPSDLPLSRDFQTRHGAMSQSGGGASFTLSRVSGRGLTGLTGWNFRCWDGVTQQAVRPVRDLGG